MAQLISNLSVGAKVEVPVLPAYQSLLGATISFLIVDKNHDGYPANSVTLNSEKLIAIVMFDVREPNNPLSTRQTLGNNRYSVSNVNQWLNSEEAEGQWYSPQHPYDAPPIYTANSGEINLSYDQWAGFLYMLDPKFVEILLTTQSITALGSYDGGTGEFDTVNSKIFLPSRTELGGTLTNGVEEGKQIAHFTSNSNRIKTYTQEALSKLSEMGYSPDSNGAWYLRTIANDTHSGSLWVIYNIGLTTGSQRNATAGNVAISPMCNVPDNIYVSDTVNSNGNYTFAFVNAPEISGIDENLGIKPTLFGYKYTVNHSGDDIINVTEAINGVAFAEKNNIEIGIEQTAYVDLDTFISLQEGEHILTITATDSFNNIVVRTLTFTKKITDFFLEVSPLIVAMVQPTRCTVSVIRDIPAGGAFKVEVSNNPFDATPVWEDCTRAVISRLAYIFANAVNSSAQYGFSVRVTVERGTALTPCWVSGIEGAFE
jgi:hypothetical protein